MQIDRKINFFGLFDISRPLPETGKEDLDWFRYRAKKLNIDWYVPSQQVEMLSPTTLVERIRGEAFLPKDWDHVRQVQPGETVVGPRRFGIQVRYSITQ